MRVCMWIYGASDLAIDGSSDLWSDLWIDGASDLWIDPISHLAIDTQFWGHFRTTFFSRSGTRWKILRNFWRFLARNFDAHLSGWVGLGVKAMTWAFFAAELEKRVSGRKNVEKKSSQNGVCLVWKLLGHLVGVFCTRLEPPNSHIAKNNQIYWKPRESLIFPIFPRCGIAL